MKSKFGSLVMLVLLTLFAVIPAWAVTRTLEGNATTGYYINMPISGIDNLTIPDGVTTFKVYDDGGKLGQFSQGAAGRLVLTAPAGTALFVSGSLAFCSTHNGYGYFDIYEGADEDWDYVLYDFDGSAQRLDIGKVVSTGNVILLAFDPNPECSSADGLDLTVRVLDPAVPHTLSVAQSAGGSLTASPATALMNADITLTATPSTGYYFKGYSVKDEDGVTIETLDTWYVGNSVSYKMPGYNATITPVFSNSFTGLSVNMPVEGSQTIVIPAGVTSFKVYDNGGSGNFYTHGAVGYLELVAPTGSQILVSGSVAVRNENTDYGDFLTIYDGNASAPKLLNEFSGAGDRFDRVTSSGNVVTLYFETHASSRSPDMSGLDLTVDVVPAYPVTVSPMVQGGSVVSDKEAAQVGETVTLTATPDNGYVLDGFVVYANGTSISVDFSKWGNTATFVMPAGAVTVTPVFVPNTDLSVNMPVSGTQNIVIPAGVASIKVYDDGGNTANYSDNAKGYLQLTAPEGRVLQVTGTVTTEGTGTDYLTIYDGATGATKLLDAFAGARSAVAADIGVISSSGRTLTLYFKSDKTMNFDGLDLTVVVGDPSVPHDVVIASVEGGLVSPDVASASVGTVVTLTAAPSTGYVLVGFEIVDVNGKSIPVTGGNWHSGNSATFTMPNSDVAVTPVFSNNLTAEGGLAINMPVAGKKSVVIPAGVSSFKLYDDGGKDGYSSNGAYGLLELTAPAGTVLNLSGRLVDVFARAYDGSDTTAFKILGSNSFVVIHDEKEYEYFSDSTVNVITTYNKLLILLASNNYYGDLDLTVSVLSPRTVTVVSTYGGRVTSGSEKAMPGTRVALSALPNTGYMMASLRVVDAYGNNIKVNGNIGRESSFIMPTTDVTVTPVFTDGLMDGSFVNIPATGSNTVTIPAGVTSIKVYDAGGNEETCCRGLRPDGSLAMYAPEGYAFMVTGNVITRQPWDAFGIDSIFTINQDYFYGEKNTEIGPLYSTSGYMTLYYKNDDSTIVHDLYADVDLTVSLVAITENPVEIVNPAVGGSIASDVNVAQLGDVVTLTAIPAEGYVLTGVRVEAEDGSSVTVSGGEWYSGNVASFVMPFSKATVSPIFTNELADLSINLPYSGTVNVKIPAAVTSFKVYDDGGSEANYSSYAYGTLQLIAPTGKTMQVTGSVSIVDDRYQSLYIYDKSSSKSILLGEFTGDTDVGTITGLGYLMSMGIDAGNATSSGIDLTISIVDATVEHVVQISNPATGGTMTSNFESATVGTRILLTASPAEGCALIGLNVVDGDGKTIDAPLGDFLTSDTTSFIMPYSNVTVTPVFTSELSAEGGIFVNMPETGTKVFQIPAGMTTFKVYDDGGKEGVYSTDAEGYLELVAPEGFALQVVGTINVSEDYNKDNLVFFDGATSATRILSTTQSGNVGPVFSSGNRLTIYFETNLYNEYSGLDLTVTVEDASVENAVVIANPTVGGTMSSDVDVSTGGRTVTLTANPADGYVLTGVNVVTEAGDVVNVQGAENAWYSNEASFVMPYSKVTVTPVFSDNVGADDSLYINIPTNGTISATISSGVKTFYVYDDGGKSGKCSNSSNGYLELTAPEGWVFSAKGTAEAFSQSGIFFYMYDGLSTSVDYLDTIRSLGSEYSHDVFVVSAGNTMMMRFAMNSPSSYGPYDGLDLAVSLVRAGVEHTIAISNPPVGGTVTANYEKATYGKKVTLLAEPAEGYYLKDVAVLDENGDSVAAFNFDMFSNNPVTFTMPNSGVNVMPTFAEANLTGATLLMPVSGTITVNVPTNTQFFKVYDDGGRNGYYSSGANGYLELIAPLGYKFRVSGTVSTYYTNQSTEYLAIYEGDQLVEKLGSVSERVARNIGAISSTGNKMKLNFRTSFTGEGLDLTIVLVPVLDLYQVDIDYAIGGAVTSDKYTSLAGDTVTLTFAPSNGYVLENMSITGCDNEPVAFEGGWVTNYQIKFAMPACNVLVTPTFVEGELFVNMPTSGTKTVNIPADVRTFKVYDDGGKDGNYSASAAGYLELIAPEGYVMGVSGSVATKTSYDYLTIRDGDNNSQSLIYQFRSTSSGVAKNLDVVRSSGNRITLYFYSYGSTTYSGLDLTVNVYDETKHLVEIDNPVEGGIIASDKENASINEVVTLTATPAAGYMLTGVNVVAEDGSTVTVTDGDWLSDNKASFVMPYSKVTVTPVFSDVVTGLSINMPVSGTKVGKIPAGVTSFKVYDDGGSGGNYTRNADGYLELTAPEGYALQITGKVKTYYDFAYLDAYDGNTEAQRFIRNVYGTNVDLDPETSSGNVATIRFHSTAPSGYDVNSGLDLTITLVPAATEFTLTVVDPAEGGTVTSSHETALVGTPIVLTPLPASGYMLSNVTVYEVDNDRTRRVAEDSWYSGNPPSFAMPYANVTVTPEFTNDLTNFSISMSRNETVTAHIPAEITTFKVYDNGGRTSNYSTPTNDTLKLVAPEGKILQISGTINVNSSYGSFSIFDGDGTSAATLLDNGKGVNVDVGLLISTSNVVTLYLKSNVSSSSYSAAGLDLVVTVLDPSTEYAIEIDNPVTGGTVAANLETAAMGDTVTLTASPASGYTLNGVNVVAENGTTVTVTGGDWLSGNTASFVMPLSKVTVTPVFTDDFATLSLNMPRTGVVRGGIPAGVTSFHVYDDGGPAGNYSSDANGSLELTAPEGYVLQVTGTVNTYYSYGTLRIYDGTAEDGSYNSFYGSDVDIGTSTSTGNVMTLYFKSTLSTVRSGLDLVVTLVEASTKHLVEIDNSVTGGTIVSNLDEAERDAAITLTATPATGYTLVGVEVTAENGEPVTVTGGDWLADNTASFVMPFSNVTVTPVFTNNLAEVYINIPKTGTKSVTIPAGVTMFKVYDSGGRQGYYENYSNGYLELTAPEGMVLAVSGTVSLEKYSDYLMIYDGFTTAPTMLLEPVYNDADVGGLLSKGNVITLRFDADFAYTSSGIDLTVQVVDPATEYAINVVNTGVEGTLESAVESQQAAKTVTLTANPASGYLLKGVTAVAANSSPVNVNRQSSFKNTLTFTMPASDVTLTPEFTNVLTADEGIFINMPSIGVETLQIPSGVSSFKVYDDGGENNSGSDIVRAQLKLVAPEGYGLRVSGTTFSSHIQIYKDGAESALLLDKDSDGDIGAVRCDGGEITIISEGENSDVDLTVSVVSLSDVHTVAVSSPIEGGSVTPSAETAVFGEPVTITVTPATGYFLKDIKVQSDDGTIDFGEISNLGIENLLAGSELTFTFNMSASDVTIVPEFSNTLTAAGGLFVNMPKTETKVVSIPAGVTSFKLYDAGGANEDFEPNSNEILKLVAPDGYAFYVDGRAEDCFLHVYDGEVGVGTLRIFNGNQNLRFTTNTSTMSLVIFSDRSSLTYIDATVSLVPVYPVNVVAADGGTVVPNASASASGEYVSLTSNPEEGYWLEGVSVVDGDGNNVSVTYTNLPDVPAYSDASFAMPNSGVTVTPSFTNALPVTILMPKTGKASANIAADGKYLVLDDGGWANSYSNYADGYLELVAPEGYVLQLTGYLNSESSYDFLTIYDGDTDAAELFEATAGHGIQIATTSSGKIVTLHFTSDNGSAYSGFNINVVAVAAEPHTITVASVTGGSLTSGASGTFYVGAPVTLSFTPDEGYFFGTATIETSDGDAVAFTEGTTATGTTVTFTMPNKDVTVTPFFANPSIVTFDGNGCLNNGTYFHLDCNETSQTCTLSQKLVYAPNVGETDFKCWNDMQQVLENATWKSATIELASDLHLGGYDADGGVCNMSFAPFGNAHAGLTGNNHTVEGFCYKASSGNAMFIGGAVAVQNVAFTDVHVEGANAYVLGGTDVSNVTVDGATITGTTTAGVLGSALNSATKVVAKNATVSAATAGGLLAQNSGSVSIFRSGFEGTVSGTLVGGIVGKFTKGAQTDLSIMSTYTVGSISGTTAGYIVGSVDGTLNTRDYVVGNFHYGDDDVALGIGSWTAADWATGSEYVYSNVRNAATGMTAEDLSFHVYEVTGASYVTYADIFAADLSGTDFGRVANGVVSESDMKSERFAAFMNYAMEKAGEDAVWLNTSGSELPVIAGSQDKPNHLIVLKTNALDASAGIDPVQLTVDPEDAANANVDFYGIVGYTDANGNVDATFLSKLESARQQLAIDNKAVYLQNENTGYQVQVTANATFMHATTIVLTVDELHQFNVVYQYCASEDACENIDDITGTTFVFTSQKVGDVSTGSDAYMSMVPFAIALGGGNSMDLTCTIAYLDENDAEIEESGFDCMDAFYTFGYVITRMQTDAPDAKGILVKYRSEYDIPTFKVNNPNSADFDFVVYGYNSTGSKTELNTYAATSAMADFQAVYGDAFAATFGDKVGYVFDSYSVSFTLANLMGDTGPCAEVTPAASPVVTDNRSVGYRDEFAQPNACTSKEWVVAGLQNGEEINLNELKAAMEGLNSSTVEANMAGEFSIIPNYTAVDYEVTFDLSSLENEIVALGQDWTNPKVLNLNDGNRKFPRLYLYGGSDTFGEMFWSAEQKSQDDPDWYEWYQANAAQQLIPNIVSTATNGNASQTSIRLYPAGITVPGNGYIPPDAKISIYSEEGDDATNFHGSVVLKQSSDGMTFAQKSRLVYGGEFTYTHELVFPSGVDDVLEYQVFFEPDPGYAMEVVGQRFGWTDEQTGTVGDAPEGWGYIGTTNPPTLKIQPLRMNDGVRRLTVQYSLLHYNVSFSIPQDADVYVANEFLEQQLVSSWMSSARSVSAEDTRAPRLLTSNGCEVSWKLSGRTVETRTSPDYVGEFAYMTSIEDGHTEPYVLVPDMDNLLCTEGPNQNATSYQQTLQVDEGEGSIAFIQKLGTGANQIVLRHDFDEQGRLNTPKTTGDVETGVKVQVVGVPAPGYTLKELTYDLNVNGNNVSALVRDSGEVNILQNLTWHAKFVTFAPVFLAFDLSLDAYDSSKVWIPANAATDTNLVIGAESAPIELWKPYRSDSCFVGWSTVKKLNPALYDRDVDVFYKEVNQENFSAFSTDATTPTTLYAVWAGNGDVDCESASMSSIDILAYYDDVTNLYSYHTMSNDTLFVVQKFGDAEFRHVAVFDTVGRIGGEPVGFAVNPYGYRMSFVIKPGPRGFELEDDSELQVIADDGSLVSGDDGWYILGSGDDGVSYSVGTKENDVLKVVLSTNSGNEPIFYGENWSASMAVRYGDNLLGASAFRLDACFAGWSFEPTSPADYAFNRYTIVSFDENLVQQREERLAQGKNVDTLYIVWADPDNPAYNYVGGCFDGMLTLALDDSIRNLVTVTLYQEVDGAEVKAFEIGSKPVYIPAGARRRLTGDTYYEYDNIYFTRAEIKANPGVTLENNAQVVYINLSDEDSIAHSFTRGGTTFDDDVVFRLEGLTKNPYSVALHENAGDANVFYGENWNANATLNVGDRLNTSLYRTDSCFVGWAFGTSGDGYVYNTVDADFITEYDALVAGDAPVNLYAVWSNDEATCVHPIQNVTVTLSNALAGRATVQLLQKVGGDPKVVATAGSEAIQISKGSDSEQVLFSALTVVPEPGYAVDESVNPSYNVGGTGAVEVTADSPEWAMTDATVLSGAVLPIGYSVAYHENVGDTTVFYGEHWSAEGTVNVGLALSMSLFRTDKCLTGWSFEANSGEAVVYKYINPEFIEEYSAYANGDEPVNLYAVWSTEDDDCYNPVQNVEVSLSDDLKGVAAVELIQTVDGEPRVITTVGENGIEIPKMKATISGNEAMTIVIGENGYFSGLRVVPATGYELVENVNPSYKIGNADAVEVAGATPAWIMDDATVLSGAVSVVGYTVTFNENGGNANVFYPSDWEESATYRIDSEADALAFPKLYRTDKCLVGWGFSKDASRAESFDTFNPAFVTAYDSVVAAGVENPVLYGVWNECTQALYKVALNDIAEGTLVMSHNGKAYNVPSTGFVVPEAVPALEFGLAFIPNLGYKLSDEGSFNLVNESGVIQSVVEDNVLAVDGDKIVAAPVATLENTFAFVTNAGNAVLFYGDDWVESATYSLDAQNVNFPKGIYRVDSCFTGWALNTESERTHLQFNTEFLDDVEATRNAGLPVDRLYAIWSACETEQTIVTVANADSLSGTFTLSRTVSQTAKTYTVAGTALQVPADEALTFVVTFVPNNGYTYDETVGITAVDATDAPVSMNGDELVVATSLTLSAAATADTYTFALNENAGDANVFYTGTLATEFTAKVIDDAATRALPMNLYRSDACLEGWNFSATAMAGFSLLDDEFVDAYNDYVAAGNEAPTTLYAVWNEDCRQTVYTVTSYDKRKGTLTLAQGSREFVVDTAGLKVPSVAGGLAFTATFTPAVGYDYDATQGLEAFNNMSQSMGVLTDGALTVTKTTVIKAVSLTASTYELVFNVNADNATVYYGDAWRAGTEQTSFTLANAGDFPSDIYRTDSCLAGWTLSTSATAGIFTDFSDAFVDSVATMDNFDGKLFAKWGNCIDVNNVTVAQVTSAAGTMTLKQIDAVGNVLNTINIDDAEVILPLGDGDVTFDVSFTVGEGYSLVDGDYFYTVNASGKNVQALLGNKLTLAGNTLLRAPVLSDAYTITFNTNAGDANVFYGAGWASEGQFAMEMNEVARTFPTEVYRVGYTLAGWSLTPAGNSGDLVFDTELATALKESGKTQVTLYAVWAAATSQQTYTVTLADAAAGYLTASQTVGKTTASFRVGEEGLEVPAVTGGLEFSVKATMNAGYFADGEKLYLLAAGGARIDSLASENGELVVDGNKIVEIPYESDGVEFAFNVNTDAHVFYEDGWTGSGAFALNGDTAFPTGILRTEGKLLGWALSRTSTKYYKAYNGTFVNDLKNYKALGLPTGTLYAVWSEYGLFDNVNVTNGNDKNGSFVITQTVNGVETEPITVNADGIQIPYSEKGLTFNVKFETKPGYYLNAEQAISGANAAGTSIGNAVNGGALVFKSNTDVVLTASVDANRFKFNYNVNGGDAYVFYGTDWSSNDEKSLNDTSVVFPTNIYRNDACLVGWSIDPADSTGSTLLTSDFIATLDRVQNVNTLYAVWKECEVETYTVTFENTNVGSLVLSQSVDDTLVTFAVEEDGLKVPVVPGGLRFRAAYTLNAGYAGNTDTLYVVDDITGILTTLADNALTVNENITLAIPTVGETFKLVFNVNREGRLFYGSDWIDSAIYMLSDKKSVIPLPNYVYTSGACMVGWSIDSTGGDTYLKFNTDLAAALLENKSADSTYRLYAIWGKGADCDDLYDRVTFTGNHGTVHLAEAPRGDKTEFIEHEFMSDGTMILPKTINGNNIRVFAVPDSSYMLDSLVMTREGADEERQVFIEGDALVFNLMDARFEGFFGKANRTKAEFANAEVLKLGNAIRFVFGTSDFEATRKVAVSVRLETIDGELVAADTITDSIPLPYNGAWDKFPLAAGKYVLTATMGDEGGSDEFVDVFEVKAEIASVSEEAWQIISIANLDKDAMVWDDDDARFYWWDESSASGDYWQYKEFDPKDDIVPTRGYWYSSLEGRPLVLKPESDVKVADKVEWKLDSISSGWNLVANPYGFALDLYADHPAENIDQTETGVTFWRWDAGIADYVPAFIVQPYEAVWVKVSAPTDWTIPVAPEFNTDNPDSTFEDDSSDVTLKALAKARRLTKANGKNDWRLQMVLSDAKGHKDSWNMLGASHNAFTTEEPPEGMGDHVKLSIVEGNRMLAKSVKAPADEQDWKIALSANSERYGELSFKGVDDINALGLKVFVTVDGKTTEMHDGMTLRVLLKSNATMAAVHVGASAKVVADLHIDGLRSVQAGRSLNVSFNASADLAGTRTVVEILNMDGKVIASRSAKTLAGTNAFALEAPRGGIYLLRVRAGSQIKAGRIMVR